MKKNEQYIGVDEKYVPSKDSEEKTNSGEKKGLKIIKGIGIGYLVFSGIMLVLIIALFIFVFNMFSGISKQSSDIIDGTKDIIYRNGDIIDSANDIIYQGIKDTNAGNFNSNLESYVGTQYGLDVLNLLDKVVTKIKKNADHSIMVVYGTTTTTNTDEIVAIKKQLEDTSKYEISFDYDSNGYIYKVTITNY